MTRGTDRNVGGGRQRHARPPPGFTMIELLVVVALLAILASLLLPSLARGKEAARTAECRANLREIGLAARMYVDEFGHYPMSNGTAIIGYDAYGMLVMSDWKETLVPYLGLAPGDGSFLNREATTRKLRCPQQITDREGSRRKGQYALNARGTGTLNSDLGIGGSLEEGHLRPTAEARVLAPAGMIAVGDVPPGTSSSVYAVCSTNVSRWPGSSHGGQANLLFCDGHVDAGRPAGLVAATDAARRRWNNDHEPHPETWDRP